MTDTNLPPGVPQVRDHTPQRTRITLRRWRVRLRSLRKLLPLAAVITALTVASLVLDIPNAWMDLEEKKEEQHRELNKRLDKNWQTLGGTPLGLVRAEMERSPERLEEVRLTAEAILNESNDSHQRYEARINLAFYYEAYNQHQEKLHQLKMALDEEQQNPVVYELLCEDALRRQAEDEAVGIITKGANAMDHISFGMLSCYAASLENIATNIRQGGITNEEAELGRLLDINDSIGFQEEADETTNYVLWSYQTLARDYPEFRDQGLTLYAQYLARRGEPRTAAEELEKELIKDPSREWSREFFDLLSYLLIEIGACERALRALEYDLRLRGTNAVLALNQAAALECLGRYETAAEVLQSLVTRDPENLWALLRFGALALRLGRLDEAEQAARRGLGLSPDEPPILYLQALIRARRGDNAGAVRLMRECFDVARHKQGHFDPIYGLNYLEVCQRTSADLAVEMFPNSSAVFTPPGPTRWSTVYGLCKPCTLSPQGNSKVPIARLDPSHIKFSPNRGTSCKDLIVISGPLNNFQGIAAENLWLENNYPGYQPQLQRLRDCAGRVVNEIQISTSEGETVNIMFDITHFFGKFDS